MYSNATKAAAQLELRKRQAEAVEADAGLSPQGFAAKYLKIITDDPNSGGEIIIPLIYKPAQVDFMSKRTGRDLVLKARQLGFSTCIQADLYRAATTGTATTLTICQDDDLTKRMRRMADTFWQHDSRNVQRHFSNATESSYPAYNSSATIITVGGKAIAKRKGRGGSNSHIHGSEVAFWPDAESVLAGALQAGKPRVVLESTPNGASGFFFELCMEALDKRGQWRLHFYAWWHDPTYIAPVPDDFRLDDEEAQLVARVLETEGLTLSPAQICWRRAKRRELKHLFAQEFAEDPINCFLLSGFGYFGNIAHIWTAQFTDGPIAGHRYAAGLDFGQTRDYTVCSIIDVTTLQQVALLRVNRLPWAEMRRRALELCKHWGVTVLWAEGNSMGTTNIEELWAVQGALGLDQLAINVFTTDNTNKASIMSALHESFQHPNGVRLLPIPEQRAEFQAFEARQSKTGAWILSAPDVESAHDDCVVATALAYYGCIFGASGGIYIP